MDAEQLSHELQLKAMTALSNVIGDYERGLISKAQALTGCRAVFDTVGGLVGGPVMDLINQAAMEYRGAQGFEVARTDSHGVFWVCGTGKVEEFSPLAMFTSDDPESGRRIFNSRAFVIKAGDRS